GPAQTCRRADDFEVGNPCERPGTHALGAPTAVASAETARARGPRGRGSGDTSTLALAISAAAADLLRALAQIIRTGDSKPAEIAKLRIWLRQPWATRRASRLVLSSRSSARHSRRSSVSGSSYPARRRLPLRRRPPLRVLSSSWLSRTLEGRLKARA